MRGIHAQSLCIIHLETFVVIGDLCFHVRVRGIPVLLVKHYFCFLME